MEDSDEEGSQEWEDEEDEIDEKLMAALAQRMGLTRDAQGKITEIQEDDDEESEEEEEESEEEEVATPAKVIKETPPTPASTVKDQKKKQDTKKQEPAKKQETKAEPKKQEAKAEPKKQEAKVEPKKQEAKVEPKKVEAKKEQPAKKEVADAKDSGKKKTLPSGLVIEDIKVGNGPRAKNGKKVRCVQSHV